MHYDAAAYLVRIGQNGRVEDAFSIPNELDLHVYNPKEEISWGMTSGFQNQLSSPPQDGMFRLLPVMVDLRTRRMNLIGGPFLEPPLAGGRNTGIRRRTGPFARVVNTDATCLYIRVEPGMASQSLDCATEGVLLRDLGPTVEADGVTWLRVATPAGVEGWASTQYLER